MKPLFNIDAPSPRPAARTLRGGPRGFTLIELLIVIAIMAILAASIGTLVDQTIVGQKELQARNDLHTECAGLFTAIAQEAAVARECTIGGQAGVTTGTLLALRSPAASTTDSADVPAPHWILYQLRNGCVTRTVLGGDETPDLASLASAPPGSTTPASASQTLTTQVETFAVDASQPGLLRVRLVARTTACRRPIYAEGATSVALPPKAKITRITIPEAAP